MRALPLAVATLLVAHVLFAAPVPAIAQDPGYGDDQGYDQDGDDSPNFGHDAPDPQEYNQTLAPYGTWVADPLYGNVWRPTVSIGWQPYVDGYWVWTAYGWTWIAPGPWAWTFHYGRWTYLPAQGWVWLPGTVWGPAWVDWYYGDGYVGWAPLGPAVTHVTVVNHFVFVRDREFCSRRLNHVVVDHRRVPGRVARDWGRRDLRRDFRPPPRTDIERVSRHGVVRVSGRPTDTVAPWRRGREGRPGRGAGGPARDARLDDGARASGDGRRARRDREPGDTRGPGDTTGMTVPPRGRPHPNRDRVERTAVVDPGPNIGAEGGAARARRERPDARGPRPAPEPHSPWVSRPRDAGGGGRREPMGSSSAPVGLGAAARPNGGGGAHAGGGAGARNGGEGRGGGHNGTGRNAGTRGDAGEAQVR